MRYSPSHRHTDTHTHWHQFLHECSRVCFMHFAKRETSFPFKYLPHQMYITQTCTHARTHLHTQGHGNDDSTSTYTHTQFWKTYDNQIQSIYIYFWKRSIIQCNTRRDPSAQSMMITVSEHNRSVLLKFGKDTRKSHKRTNRCSGKDVTCVDYWGTIIFLLCRRCCWQRYLVGYYGYKKSSSLLWWLCIIRT